MVKPADKQFLCALNLSYLTLYDIVELGNARGILRFLGQVPFTYVNNNNSPLEPEKQFKSQLEEAINKCVKQIVDGDILMVKPKSFSYVAFKLFLDPIRDSNAVIHGRYKK